MSDNQGKPIKLEDLPNSTRSTPESQKEVLEIYNELLEEEKQQQAGQQNSLNTSTSQTSSTASPRQDGNSSDSQVVSLETSLPGEDEDSEFIPDEKLAQADINDLHRAALLDPEMAELEADFLAKHPYKPLTGSSSNQG